MPHDHTSPALPQPRGPLSAWVLDRLCGGSLDIPPVPDGGGLGEDAQLALYLCYESHFGAMQGVAATMEWDPQLIGLRRALEARMEDNLRLLISPIAPDRDVAQQIAALVDADDGPSMSRHMECAGTLEQMREFVTHRAAYQRKEGDGHTFAIPRLTGRAKQVLIQIQSGEYGADEPGREIHAELFAQTMRGLGLDDRPNALLNQQPASALAISNLISLFGLNRRLRGALVGHLAVFETTSVEPMGRYARGLRRMGAPESAARFYDVHVLADAEHQVMVMEMVRAFVADEPDCAGDVLFGAQCALFVDTCFANVLLSGWATRRRLRGALAA